MLNFLLQGNQKQIVGLALTPGIGLEAVVLDNKSGKTIVNYGRKRVDYNFSQREIDKYPEFKAAFSELMDELKVSSQALVYIVLPNVYFNFIELAPSLDDAQIKTAVLSEAEEFYIFKREEPVSGWADVSDPQSGTRKIAYSSIQRNAIEELKEMAADLGFSLAGIEGSYSATLRGLYITGALDDVILEQAPWTAMLIGTNSYTLFQFRGSILLNCNEVPLAIRSFSAEEAYEAIVSSSSQFLDTYPSQKLFIISQTDDISSEVLRNQMRFEGEVVTIDSNKFSKKPLLEVLAASDFNEANSLTLAAIGAAKIKTDFNLTLNALADDPTANTGVYLTTKLFGKQIDITSEFIKKAAILSVGACVIVFGAISGVCSVIDSSAQNKIGEISGEVQSIDTQIAALTKEDKKPAIDMTSIIDEIVGMNVSAINFYDSIATDIPKNVWLTQYYNQAGSKLAIRGIAQNIVDIYEYYKNLRFVSPQSDIKLTELKVVTDEFDNANKSYLSNITIDKDVDRLYSFEISNTQLQQAAKDGQNPDQQGGLLDNMTPTIEQNESVIIDKSSNTQDPSKAKIEQPSAQMKPQG